MNSEDRPQRQPIDRLRMNGWAYFSAAVLIVVALVANVLLLGAVYLARRNHSHPQPPATSVIVRSPVLISGPAIEMSLPAGTNLTSSTVDANGGNWWYQDPGVANLQVLIAASKFATGQPAVTDTYFERVIRIVEHSSGDLVTSMGAVQSEKVGSYNSRLAPYDVTQMDGTHEHAVALLVRRESDDLLVVLYGDEGASATVDQTAHKMFNSLHPHPTPDQYDIHSVRTTMPGLPRQS